MKTKTAILTLIGAAAIAVLVAFAWFVWLMSQAGH